MSWVQLVIVCLYLVMWFIRNWLFFVVLFYSHFQTTLSLSDTGIIFFNQIKKKSSNKKNSQIKPKPIQQHGILTLVNFVRLIKKEQSNPLGTFWASAQLCYIPIAVCFPSLSRSLSLCVCLCASTPPKKTYTHWYELIVHTKSCPL